LPRKQTARLPPANAATLAPHAPAGIGQMRKTFSALNVLSGEQLKQKPINKPVGHAVPWFLAARSVLASNGDAKTFVGLA